MASPLFADIDPKAIEAAADEFVGPVGSVEYKQLVEKLGGTRRNRVFSFFGINPPRHEAETAMVEAEEKKQQREQQKDAGGAGATSALEKKKQRGKAGGASAPKHPKLLESIFASKPIQAKGNSEDNVDVVDCEEPPRSSPAAATPIAVAPIAIRRAPALEYSAMAEESDEDEGHKDSPITIESRPAQTIPEGPQAGAAAKSNAQDDSESSSEPGDDGEDKPLGEAPERAAVSSSSGGSDSSGDNSAYLVGNADPREVADALGALGAKLIGGQVVGSLRFESRD